MRRFFRNNGLTLVYLALFLVTLAVMSIVGHHRYNADRQDHGERPVTYSTYLHTGDFIEGVFENWESEFLQMGTFVLFTVFLFQRGSSESKPVGERTPQDTLPERQRHENRPWPVRKGGLWLRLYMNSLAIALFALFLLSLVVHALGGTWAYNEDQLAHGGQPVGVLTFVTTSEFWYQSMQNWQSEFLAVASLAVLSIFLRQHGSPESKPVGAHTQRRGLEPDPAPPDSISRSIPTSSARSVQSSWQSISRSLKVRLPLVCSGSPPVGSAHSESNGATHQFARQRG